MFLSERWPREENHSVEWMREAEVCQTDCSHWKNGYFRRQQHVGFGRDYGLWGTGPLRVLLRNRSPWNCLRMLLLLPGWLIHKKTELEKSWEDLELWCEDMSRKHRILNRNMTQEKSILISMLKDFSTLLYYKVIKDLEGPYTFFSDIILWEKWYPRMLFVKVGVLANVKGLR